MKLFHIFAQIYFKESLEGLSTMCHSIPLFSQPNRQSSAYPFKRSPGRIIIQSNCSPSAACLIYKCLFLYQEANSRNSAVQKFHLGNCKLLCSSTQMKNLFLHIVKLRLKCIGKGNNFKNANYLISNGLILNGKQKKIKQQISSI